MPGHIKVVAAMYGKSNTSKYLTNTYSIHIIVPIFKLIYIYKLKPYIYDIVIFMSVFTTSHIYAHRTNVTL